MKFTKFVSIEFVLEVKEPYVSITLFRENQDDFLWTREYYNVSQASLDRLEKVVRGAGYQDHDFTVYPSFTYAFDFEADCPDCKDQPCPECKQEIEEQS